ncbi:MAG: hypothetical protein ABII18_01445 [bacterium]|nr:hypothetical protein [bacterium]MBU1919111.1 hypothetical protein [bacterium]
MYKKIRNITLVVIIAVVQLACGGGSGSGKFIAVNHIAVDSTNDRLFMTEPSQRLFALTASTLEDIAEEQPIVAEEVNEAIYALLPNVVTHLGAYTNGTSSRLFVMGSFKNSDGTYALNKIRVLDFDGTSFTQPSFSPITISDGDEATDETDNTFAALLVDQENGVVYVTDSSDGQVYGFSATDGSVVVGPMGIAGNPSGLALDNGYLYVCNASNTEDEQLITVYDVSDYASTTIDKDMPCTHIAVKSNDTGTVMLVKRRDEQRVDIFSVDTATYDAATAIASEASSLNDGYLTDSDGITSAINGIVLVVDTDDSFYGYLSEWDGNIEMLTINSNLNSYSLDTLSTSVTNITEGSSLNTSSGAATTAYLISEAGALISVAVGSTEVIVND